MTETTFYEKVIQPVFIIISFLFFFLQIEFIGKKTGPRNENIYAERYFKCRFLFSVLLIFPKDASRPGLLHALNNIFLSLRIKNVFRGTKVCGDIYQNF